MGRALASCSDRQRKVSKKRYSARSSHPGQSRRPPADTQATRPANKPRGAKPLRSEAELDLARRMLAALHCGTDLRVRKVRRLKAAIKVRAYENDLKFQVAFERLRAGVEVG
jgi:hypothetical protein